MSLAALLGADEGRPLRGIKPTFRQPKRYLLEWALEMDPHGWFLVAGTPADCT
jgi:hypothetical protein